MTTATPTTKILREDLKQLLAKLTARGGDRFQVPWFVNAEVTALMSAALLHGGEFAEGKRAKMVPGEPRACHDNAAKLVRTRPGYELWFGFALSAGDGCWRVHSWATDTHGRLVETTEPRVLYYGVRIAA